MSAPTNPIQRDLDAWDGIGEPPGIATIQQQPEYQTLPPADKITALNTAQLMAANRIRTDDPANYGDVIRDVETDFQQARQAEVETHLATDLAAGKFTDQQVKDYTAGRVSLMDYPEQKDLAGPWVTNKFPITGADGKPQGYAYIRHDPALTAESLDANIGTSTDPRLPSAVWKGGNDRAEVSWVINGKGEKISGVEDVGVGEHTAMVARSRALLQDYATRQARSTGGAQEFQEPEPPAEMVDRVAQFDTMPSALRPAMAAVQAFSAMAQKRPEISDKIGQGFWQGLPGEAAKGMIKLGNAFVHAPFALAGDFDAVRAWQQGDEEINADIEGQSRLGFRGALTDKVLQGISSEALPMAASMGAGAIGAVARKALTSAVGKTFLSRMAALEMEQAARQGLTGMTREAAAKLIAGELTGEGVGSTARQGLMTSIARGYFGKWLGTAEIEGPLARQLADRVTNAVAFLPSSARSGMDNMATTLNKAAELRAAGDESGARELERNAVVNGWAGVGIETLSENIWLNEMMVTRAGHSLAHVSNAVLERTLQPGLMAKLAERGRQFVKEAIVRGNEEGVEEVVAGMSGRQWMNEFARQNQDLLSDVPQEYVTGAALGSLMSGARALAQDGQPAAFRALVTRGIDGDIGAMAALARIRTKADAIASQKALATAASATNPPGTDATLSSSPPPAAESGAVPGTPVPGRLANIAGNVPPPIVTGDATEAPAGPMDNSLVPPAPADVAEAPPPEGIDPSLVEPPPADAAPVEAAPPDTLSPEGAVALPDSTATDTSSNPELVSPAVNNPDPMVATASPAAPGNLLPMPDEAPAAVKDSLTAAPPAPTSPGTKVPENRPAPLLQVTTQHGVVWYHPGKTTREAVTAAGQQPTFDPGLLGQTVIQAPAARTDEGQTSVRPAPDTRTDAGRTPAGVADNAATDAVRILRSNAPELLRNVRIVRNADALPDLAPATRARVSGPQVEGYHDRTTGQTTLFLDNITPRAGETPVGAVARVIQHEQVGHAGLDAIRSADPKFSAEWDALVKLIPAEELTALLTYYPDLADNKNALAEEWLARRAEKAIRYPSSLAGRIWAAIRNAIARIWRGLRHGKQSLDDRVRELLDRSRLALKSQPAATPGEGIALSVGPVGSVPKGWDTNRFGIRVKADERIRDSWRAAFDPRIYKTFGEEELMRRVAEWIGQAGGLEDAAAFFMAPDNGLQDYERNALGQQIVIGLDQRTRRAEAAGNAKEVERLEAVLDEVMAVLEQLATQAGQALRAFGLWTKLSPRGIVRATDRKNAETLEASASVDLGAAAVTVQAEVNTVAAAAEKTIADSEEEIMQIWRAMQGAGQTARGAAIAGALRAYMPRGPRNWQRTMDRDAQDRMANIRDDMQSRGGEGLARRFWQMMAGPAAAPGALAAFDTATQAMLSDLLQRAVKAAGLMGDRSVSNQPTAIDKLVLNLSNDPLRWEKIATADAAVRAEIEAIADPAQRAALDAAWTEATSSMATAIGGPALMTRALTDALKAAGPNWKAIFDTGVPAGTATAALKAATVDAVAGKITARLTTDHARALIPHLRTELAAAFDDIVRTKHATWLEQRAAIANAARVREARSAMLAALRERGVAEKALAKLANLLSDTPDWGRPSTVHPITQLIAEHTKAPVDDFTDRMAALGVPLDVALPLERAISMHRARIAAATREKALQSLVDSLTRTAPARSGQKIPPFVAALYKAAAVGGLSRPEFLDAYAKHFDKPRFTHAFASEIRQQVERVQATPASSWLRTRENSRLMAMIARFEGLKSGEIFTAFWYANILSGIGTQVVNLTGNASHLLLRTVQVGLTNHPRHTFNFIRGMLAGLNEGRKQARAAFVDGEPVMRGDEEWQKMDVLELLWDDNPATWGRKLAKYGAASWGRYVFRGLTAADSLFWNGAKEGRAWLDISRTLAAGGDILTATGLDAATWAAAQTQAAAELRSAGRATPHTRDVDRRAYEIVEAARPPDVTHAARKWGAYATYNYDPEGTMGAIAGGINFVIGRIPAIRAVVPFVRIVANITDVNLDWTPVGLLRAAAGRHLANSKGEKFTVRERAERAISGAIGTLGFAALYALASGYAGDDDDKAPFMIYGMGPRDASRRAQMPGGWKPFSVKMGGQYYSFDGTPLAFIFGTIGTALDQRRYGNQRGPDEAGERALALLTAAPRTVMNSGVLSSLNQTFEMLNGDRRPGAWSERMAASLLPGASLLKDVATAIDPVQTDSRKFGATFLSYLPFLRAAGQPLLNVFGEPVKAPGPWIIQRLVRSQERGDPEALFLTQHKLAIPGLDNEIAVGQWLTPRDKPKSLNGLKADREFRAGIIDRIANGHLTPEEATEFVRTTGPRIRAAVKILAQKTATAGKPPDQGDITAAVSRIRREAMKALIK